MKAEDDLNSQRVFFEQQMESLQMKLVC